MKNTIRAVLTALMAPFIVAGALYELAKLGFDTGRGWCAMLVEWAE